MKRKNTIWSLVLALVMVLGVIAPLSALAKEPAPTVGTFETGDYSKDHPGQTTVIIHKLQADSFDTTKVPTKHNGGVLKPADYQALGTNVKALAGVTFAWYKVSEKDFKTMEADKTNYDTADKVDAKIKANSLKVEAQGVTDPTDAQGVANASNLADGYYWFVEKSYNKVGDGPDSISSSYAVPFGLSLPLMNTTKIVNGSDVYEPGTAYLKNVNVYPKNVTGNKPTPEKDVNEINQKDATFDIGKPIDWIIKGVIPANIGDYTKYELTDALDDRLTFMQYDKEKNVDVKVYYGNFANKEELLKATPLVANEDYTFSHAVDPDTNKDTLKISLKTAKTKYKKEDKVKDENEYVKLKYKAPEAGKPENKLYVVFKTKINEKAIMGQDIKNGVDLTFNNKPGGKDDKTSIPENEKPKVVTGGKLFKKVNDATPEKPLENAVFTIQHKRNEVKKEDANKFVLPKADNEVWKSATALTWTEDLIKANQAAIDAGKFAKDTNGNVFDKTKNEKPTVGEPIYLRSDSNGAFEIKGLELSDYTTKVKEGDALVDKYVQNYYALKEVKAPKDYAKIEEVKPFEINKTSYYSTPDTVTLGTDAGNADPLKVVNKELTIPQTGGMGTMIFMVAGIALMGGAFIAMRKRSAEQA